MNRIPRPAGLSQAAIDYRNSNRTAYALDKIIYIISKHYLDNSNRYCGYQIDVLTLADKTYISLGSLVARIKGIWANPLVMRELQNTGQAKDLSEASVKIHSKDVPKLQDSQANPVPQPQGTDDSHPFENILTQHDFIQGLMLQAAQNTLLDRGRILTQVEMLTREQGGRYVPFVSDSVLKSLDLLLKSNKQITETIVPFMARTGGVNVNILNPLSDDRASDRKEQYITIIEAQALVEKELPSGEKKYLELGNGETVAEPFSLLTPDTVLELAPMISEIPSIIATNAVRTDGRTDRLGKPTDEYAEDIDFQDLDLSSDIYPLVI